MGLLNYSWEREQQECTEKHFGPQPREPCYEDRKLGTGKHLRDPLLNRAGHQPSRVHCTESRCLFLGSVTAAQPQPRMAEYLRFERVRAQATHPNPEQ